MDVEGGTAYEAGDLTSDHGVEIFRAWKKSLPGYDWTRAVVDRYDGLTLFTDDEFSASLHFVNALCGYGGSGPHATAEILHEAGFGELGELLGTVSSGANTKLSFTK